MLSKQEVTTRRDPTSSVKVILWESWVNSLKSNKTYLLQNLKVKTNKNERYLNTAKDEKFLFQEIEPFQVPLADVDPTNETASITGKIVAVQQVTNLQSKFLISFHNDFIFLLWPILQKLKQGIMGNTKEQQKPPLLPPFARTHFSNR